MSSRLAMKRFSRSASSWMVREQLALGVPRRASAGVAPSVPAAPRMAASGVRRSCEIEVSSAERSRSVSAASSARVDVLDELDALDRERRLVGQRIEQAPLLGRQQRPLPVAVDADDADRRRARCASAGTGACAPGSVSAPRPAGRLCSQAQRAAASRPRRACPPADSRP